MDALQHDVLLLDSDLSQGGNQLADFLGFLQGGVSGDERGARDGDVNINLGRLRLPLDA